jgi:TonB family protein
MNNLFIYLFQSGVNLAIMYSFYSLFMRNDNLHRTGRFYLLFSVFSSLIIPLINFKITVSAPSNYFYLLEEIVITPSKIAESISGKNNLFQIVTIIYISVAGIFLIRFLFQMAKLVWMIRKFGSNNRHGLNIVLTNRKNEAFSFFNYVFLGSDITHKSQVDKILAHERIHFRQFHSIDLIILELLTIFQWFNPFIWMVKYTFRNLHEYLADEGVLTLGIKKTDYQKMLLHHTFGINYNFLTNSFNHSLIKRRFIMMSKVQKSKRLAFKAMLILPVSLTMMLFFSSSFTPQIIAQETKKADGTKSEKAVEEKSLQHDDVFTVVEKMPEYPGGEDARIKFMVENLKYPEEAKKSGVQGVVFVSFVVEKDGKISNIKTLRGIGGGCDEEAERVISLMPSWKPGIQKGQLVRVQFNMPVRFRLDKDNKPKENTNDKHN